MKAFVKVHCIDSNRKTHKPGSVIELDRAKDSKLLDLGLVEQYDEKKHGQHENEDDKLQAANTEIAKLRDEVKSIKDNAPLEEANEALKVANARIAELDNPNETLDAANAKIVELEEANVALDGFVQAAMKLQKGQTPTGYKKA